MVTLEINFSKKINLYELNAEIQTKEGKYYQGLIRFGGDFKKLLIVVEGSPEFCNHVKIYKNRIREIGLAVADGK